MSAPLSICMDDSLHPRQKVVKVKFVPAAHYQCNNNNSNNSTNGKSERHGAITVSMSRESNVREMEVALQETISSLADSSRSWKHFWKRAHKSRGLMHLLTTLPVRECESAQETSASEKLVPLAPHTTLNELVQSKFVNNNVNDINNNGNDDGGSSKISNPLDVNFTREVSNQKPLTNDTLTLYYEEETKYGDEAELCLACCAMMACCAACCAASEAMENRQQQQQCKPNSYNNCNGGYPNQVPNYNVPPQQPNYYPNPIQPQQYPPPPGVNDNYYSQNQYGLPPNATTPPPPPPPQQPVYGQPIYYNQPPPVPQPQYNTGKPVAL